MDFKPNRILIRKELDKVTNDLADYVNLNLPRHIIIYGSKGSGKTLSALIMAKALKESMEDLKGRINSTNLRVIIIVPNKELIDRYQGIGKNVVILTADSLKNLLLVPDKEPHSNF